MKNTSFLSIFLATFFPLLSFSGIRGVNNGGGFSEFVLVRTQAQMAKNWSDFAQGSTCLSSTSKAQVLLLAQIEKKNPANLNFLEEIEFQKQMQSTDAVVSNVYPLVISASKNSEIFVRHQASLAWTNEVIVSDVLLEAGLLRLQFKSLDREVIRSCYQKEMQQSYFTLDLRTYRQMGVGLLVNQSGQLFLVDDEKLVEASSLVPRCTEGLPSILSGKTKSISGQGVNLSWVVEFNLNDKCQINAKSLILKLDYMIENGSFDDFLAGKSKIQLFLTKKSTFLN